MKDFGWNGNAKNWNYQDGNFLNNPYPGFRHYGKPAFNLFAIFV